MKTKRTWKSWLMKLLKIGAFLIALGVLLLSLFIGAVYFGAFGPLPSKYDLKEIQHEEAGLVFSADSVMIGKFFAENRTNVKFDSLPDHLVDALIATEDVRFYEHEGVDNWALLRVAVKTILLGDRSAGGGSTISQQLAKNLFGRESYGRLTLPVNKIKEMILANRLENLYEKDEIIQLYLNTVPFAENTFGIGSASFRYFNKTVPELSVKESATLVAMLKAPTYYNPHLNPENARERRNLVLYQLAEYDFLEESEVDSLQKLPLEARYANLTINNPNGYFLDRVKKRAGTILSGKEKDDGEAYDLEKDGLVIRTTLNDHMQQKALEARQEHLQELQQYFDQQWRVLRRKDTLVQRRREREIKGTPTYKRLKQKGLGHSSIMDSLKISRPMQVFNWKDESSSKMSVIDSVDHYLKMLHSSVFAMNPNNGEVKVYVGGNSYSYLPYDLVLSQRQAASTFKPFVYTAALREGLEPCEWINNEPQVYSEYSDWTPRNYDDSRGGYYSVQGALLKSMNIPTVSIYFATGHEPIESLVESMGFSGNLPNEPSVALGAMSVSLYEMVRAYGVFANGGSLVGPVLIRSIEDAQGEIIYHADPPNKKTILKEEIATLMQQMLKGVVDSGTATALHSEFRLEGEWGGKTGTSQNYSDAWFIGFNPNLVTGVWVGARYPAVHFTSGMGSGSQAALPIFGRLMRELQGGPDRKRMVAEFPDPTEELMEQLDCPCYRDENALEKVGDFFKRIFTKSVPQEEAEESDKKPEEKEEKRGFLRRLFGGDKD